MSIYVEFFQDPVEDRAASLNAGHPVFKDVEFAKFVIPGSGDTNVRRVNDEIRGEYGQQYDAWKRNQEAPLEGMDIRQWAAITRSLAEEAIRLNIRTVEDLATVPDTAIQKLGAGWADLRAKALRWIESAEKDGIHVEKIRDLEEKNKAQVDEIADLKAAVAELKAQLPDKPNDASKSRPKRGE